MIRLATFNVLHGRSLADGRVDNQRLADACASLDADVLCLQEIDRNQPRSGGVDQTALVAEAMGAAGWRFQPALIGEPGGDWRAASHAAGTASGDAADTAFGHAAGTAFGHAAGTASGDAADTAFGHAAGDDEPAYGVGLVSRLPVTAWHTVPLPAAPVRSPVAVPGDRRLRGRTASWRAWRVILLPDEPRVGLVAELAVASGAGPALVATSHLSFVPGYNLLQVRRLTARVAALAAGRPAVLLGDLNAPGPLPGWASGWRSLASAKTFPADKPSFQVDHVLASGPVPAPIAVEARLMPLSDHRALVVDLQAPTEPSA